MLDDKIKIPLYSYELAKTIEPFWEKLSFSCPLICSGSYHSRTINCGKEVIWWHPHVSSLQYFCEECCPPYQKKLYRFLWKKTKLQHVMRNWFSTNSGKLTSKIFNVNPQQQEQIIDFVIYGYWELYELEKFKDRIWENKDLLNSNLQNYLSLTKTITKYFIK